MFSKYIFFPVEILPTRLKGNFPFSSISHTTHSKNRSAVTLLTTADLRPSRKEVSSPAARPHHPSLRQRGPLDQTQELRSGKLSLKDRERKRVFSYIPGSGRGTPVPQPRGRGGGWLSAGGRKGPALSTASGCSSRAELVRDKYVHRKSSA